MPTASARTGGRLAAALALAAAVILLAPSVARADDRPAPATMSLTGFGEVAAEPDMATISSGVVSEGRTARAALDANNAAMAEVLAAMRRAGIADRDLQTSRFRVEPQYFQPPQGRDGRQEPPRIVGYRVSNQLAVRVRDLAALGAVLDLAVGLGANQVSGVSFSLAETAEPMREARTKAMADALAKAELYAAAAGVRLKRILSIDEQGAVRPAAPVIARAMRAEAADAVPLAAGEIRLNAEVNVTWEIGP